MAIVIVDMAGGACDQCFFGMSDGAPRPTNECWATRFASLRRLTRPSRGTDRPCPAVARDLVELNREAIGGFDELYRRSEIDGDEAAMSLAPRETAISAILWSPARMPAVHSAHDRRENRIPFRAMALPPRGDGLTRRVDGHFI